MSTEIERVIPEITEERLAELRAWLGKIEGADGLPWVVEVYDPNTGHLAAALDIRTGQPVRRRYHRKGQEKRPPGRHRSASTRPGHTK
jgi:hypothetical protein